MTTRRHINTCDVCAKHGALLLCDLCARKDMDEIATLRAALAKAVEEVDSYAARYATAMENGLAAVERAEKAESSIEMFKEQVDHLRGEVFRVEAERAEARRSLEEIDVLFEEQPGQCGGGKGRLLMLTREDIEQIYRASQAPDAHVGAPLVKQQFADLCRLALLGLAVVESGVTAEDIMLSSWCITDPTGDARCHADYVYELRDALAAALRSAT